MPKVLLADDDQELLQSVSAWLEHHKYHVDLASDGAEARAYITEIQYDVIILDWTMPEVSGVELCQWYRSKGGTTPILMLTGKDEIEDKEKGLDSGADDYLTKPFDLRELTARLQALLRRGKNYTAKVSQVGPLKIDADGHTIMVDGHQLKLTATEFAVLEFLSRHPDQVFSADALISRVWKTSSEISPDTVRVYVKRLRDKLEEAGYPKLLINMHGVGYKLAIADFHQQS